MDGVDVWQYCPEMGEFPVGITIHNQILDKCEGITLTAVPVCIVL
jgi:hypothetical protein